MFKLNLKFTTGAALAGALLAGCGGGSDSVATTPPMSQTITDVAAYVANLMASTDANAEPMGLNGLTLVANDTAEPAVIN